MGKRSRSKKRDMRTHFQKRCLQRLGYLPSMKKLVMAIQNGELEFYERQSNRVTVWKWLDPVQGVSCLLPYDKERKQIITVLTEDLFNSDSDVYLDCLDGEDIECL